MLGNRYEPATAVTQPEYWEEIIIKARANGFIDEIHLPGLLAIDPQYHDILPLLWKRFNLDLRKSIPDITTPDGRAVAWWHLIARWTSGTIAGVPGPPMSRLPCEAGSPGLINLEDLNAFFIKWEIPLPPSLFGPKFKIQKNSECLSDFTQEDIHASDVEMDNIKEKIAFGSTGFLPDSNMISQAKNELWQFDRANEARSIKTIKGPCLVCVMAYDQTYNSLFSTYWSNFQLDAKGDHCPDPSIYISRVYIWTALFERWTNNIILDENCLNIGKDPIKTTLRVEESQVSTDESTIFIEIDKLREFLTVREIPLPTALFPAQNKTPAILNSVSNEQSEPCIVLHENLETNRDPNLEKVLWDRHIDPIIKAHNLKTINGEYFKYRFYKKEIDNASLDRMLRKTMMICMEIVFPKIGVPAEESNCPYSGEDDFITSIVRRLRDSTPGPQIFSKKDGGEIDLRDVFRDFLDSIFKEETLPEFLALLRYEAPIVGRHDLQHGIGNDTSNFHVESNPDELIYQYGIAAEKLYFSMINSLQVAGKTLTSSGKADLKTAAIDAFGAAPQAFHPLIRHHLESDSPYVPTEKQKRKTIGMIIKSAMSNASNSVQNYQKLYAKFQELKKQRSKIVPK